MSGYFTALVAAAVFGAGLVGANPHRSAVSGSLAVQDKQEDAQPKTRSEGAGPNRGPAENADAPGERQGPQDQPAGTPPNPDEVFKQLDKNGNGLLEAGEIDESRRRFFDSAVRSSDANRDGMLSLDEFKTALADPPAERRSRRSFFEFIDVDQNGLVSREEVTRLPDTARRRLLPLFAEVGKDTVTESEVTEFMARSETATSQQQQVIQNIARRFERMDTDGDGRVTAAEAPEPFNRVLAGMLQRANRAEDAALTREEFLDLARMTGSLGTGSPGSGGGGGGQRTGPPAFQRLDADGNGRLSVAELKRAAELLADLDRNGDGEIDLREFVGTVISGAGRLNMRDRANRDPSPQRQESAAGKFVKRFFDQFDKNGDGKLFVSELPQRVIERFGQIDRNEDGAITPEELGEAIQEQARSERP